MGDELRVQYAGLKDRALVTALSQRRKAVDVSRQVCVSWLEKYAAVDKAPPGKRRRGVAEPLAASSAAASSVIATHLLGAKAVDRPDRHIAFLQGQTPLHAAASAGLADQVLLLLEARADPSSRNDLGLTPGESGLAFGFEYSALLAEDALR